MPSNRSGAKRIPPNCGSEISVTIKEAKPLA